MAGLAAARPDLEIWAVIDTDPNKIGRDAGEVAGLSSALGVAVSGNAAATLRAAGARVALHSTVSSLERAEPQIAECLDAGLAVISTCEELVFPWRRHSEIADRLDALARERQVALLGAGINPGFMMDTLACALTGICSRVRGVDVRRVVDASTRREPLQRKIGAGLTPAQFRERVLAGGVRHVGMLESLGLVAHALGWEMATEEETIEPIVAGAEVASRFMRVAKGHVLGVHQVASGRTVLGETIRLELRMALGLPDAGDTITLDSDPPVSAVVRGVQGDLSTAALAVNAIARVLAAPPGLRTMLDLPPAVCRSPDILG